MQNIILIGMPGCGKSTVGVVLAKELNMDFLDTDLLIQQQTGHKLQEIIEERGLDGFLALEAAVVSGVQAQRTVIATGGSVIFDPHAMAHLHTLGTIFYLDVPVAELEKRLSNIATRGVIMQPGESIADIHRVRAPLYERYADQTIHADGRSLEQMVELLAQSAAAL